MPTYVIGNFLTYCIVNAFTPGPGNILALNTVTNYGWNKGKPLFLESLQDTMWFRFCVLYLYMESACFYRI